MLKGPTDTSKDSYNELAQSETMGRCKRLVYNFIKDNPGSSIKEIKEGTGLLQENVCGRKKELEEEGLITKAGESTNRETNRRVELWQINTKDLMKQPTEKQQCITIQSMDKINQLIKKANNYQRDKIKEWCVRWKKQN